MPRCQADLGLIGSVVNERNPQLSRAVVRSSAGTAVVALGGRIDRFLVAAVRSGGAALRDSDGSLCALHEFAGLSAPPAMKIAADEVKEPVPHGKAVFSLQELSEGVRQLGDDQYLVRKTFLLKALTNPGGSAGGAWFRVPKNKEASDGMEVLGVREGSALAAMGIQNNDVIRNLNGIALDGATGLISALRTAREVDHVVISVERAGQPRALRYQID